MNIAKAARATGLTPDTIRFYERKGVLPAPARRTNGYREYNAEHLASLRLARGLREMELPLDGVAEIVRVAHDATCGDVRKALAESMEETLGQIDERIRKLRRTRQRLEAMLTGIRGMGARSKRVPGLTPCACVKLIDQV